MCWFGIARGERCCAVAVSRTSFRCSSSSRLVLTASTAAYGELRSKIRVTDLWVSDRQNAAAALRVLNTDALKLLSRANASSTDGSKAARKVLLEALLVFARGIVDAYVVVVCVFGAREFFFVCFVLFLRYFSGCPA